MMLPISSDVARGALAFLGSAAIKSSAVILIAATATRLRGTSAAVRHAIWAAAVATVVAIPVAQLLLPSWEVAVLPAAAIDASAAIQALPPEPAVANVSEDAALPAATPAAASSEGTGSATRAATPLLDEPVLYVIEDSDSPARNAGSASANRFSLGWPGVAFGIWLLGALAVLAPWALGVVRRRNLWRGSSSELPDGWRDAWRYIPTFVDRVIEVRASDLTTVPMTWGVFAPVILAPRAPQWTATERRAALLHELAHIARFDTVWQGVSRAMLVIFWFNPLAWIADAILRAESERACDDAVLRAGTRPSEYAQQLLEVLRSGGEQRMPAVAAMSMARRSGMAKRLRALLDAGQERGRLPRRLRLSLVAASGVVAVPVARLTPVPVAAAPVDGPVVIAAQRIQMTDGPGTAAAIPTAAPVIAGGPVNGVPAAVAQSAVERFTAAFGTSLTSALASTPGVRSLLSAAKSQAALGALATDATPAVAGQREDCLNMRKSASSSMNWESSDGRTKRTRVKWSVDDCRLTFELLGDITLNADATDVVSLSRGGSLELEVKDGAVVRRVQLEEKGGSLDRQYWVNGDRKPWDADAAAWFSTALVALDRRTAFAADQRLPLILKKGGVEGALSEIEMMYSDYAQRIYYSKLFKLQPLTAVQIRRVLAHVGTSLSSDYERAELLLAISKLDVFRDEAYVDYANAASGIKSAYEKRRALGALLAQNNLKPQAVKALLEAAQGMESDYELAELLVGVAKQYAISDETRPLYLAALGSLESDYEHRRVLDTIVNGGGLSPSVTKALLQASARIKSDYELAEFLVHLANAGVLDATNADEFFTAHASIQGDYESHRVLSALLKGGRTDRAVLLRVLKASDHLGSDYERASLLVEVANVGKMDDTLREAYQKAADGVKSEYEYGRAMSALRKSTR